MKKKWKIIYWMLIFLIISPLLYTCYLYFGKIELSPSEFSQLFITSLSIISSTSIALYVIFFQRDVEKDDKEQVKNLTKIREFLTTWLNAQ